jgi:hypothetical protein
MHMVKLMAAFGALMFSSLGLAQTTFECGTVACSAFGNQPITGIDNLVVDGEHFDLTFSNTVQALPFQFSDYASAAGQPLTGVDAANALNAFYATQQGPNPQDDGPGILAKVGGVEVDIFDIVTAYQPTSKPGIFNVDLTEPLLGLPYQPVLEANQPNSGVFAESGVEGAPCNVCTIWTPISAKAVPEISPSLAISALTLLVGCIIVLRGRRSGQRAS